MVHLTAHVCNQRKPYYLTGSKAFFLSFRHKKLNSSYRSIRLKTDLLCRFSVGFDYFEPKTRSV